MRATLQTHSEGHAVTNCYNRVFWFCMRATLRATVFSGGPLEAPPGGLYGYAMGMKGLETYPRLSPLDPYAEVPGRSCLRATGGHTEFSCLPGLYAGHAFLPAWFASHRFNCILYHTTFSFSTQHLISNSYPSNFTHTSPPIPSSSPHISTHISLTQNLKP